MLATAFTMAERRAKVRDNFVPIPLIPENTLDHCPEAYYNWLNNIVTKLDQF